MDEEGPMARNRTQTFTFRVSTDERRMIKTLAARWQRTESDTVRLLVRAAAQEWGLSVAAKADMKEGSYPPNGERQPE
jgi:uncharacterized protein (DUF1778 family)